MLEETETAQASREEPQAAEPLEVAEPPAPPAPESPSVPPEALATVEALLYASGKPVAVARLSEASELAPDVVESALAELEKRYGADERGIRLDRVAGGVRVVTRPEFDDAVRKLLGYDGKTKLTMAALETLAIIAYRQPVTAPEIAELRGVSSASSVRTPLDRKLITTAGRKEVVGTPFLYKTTKEFLVHFGLSELTQLPKPEELEALYGVEVGGPPDPSQTELFSQEELAPEEAEPEAPAEPSAETPAGMTSEIEPPDSAPDEPREE